MLHRAHAAFNASTTQQVKSGNVFIESCANVSGHLWLNHKLRQHDRHRANKVVKVACASADFTAVLLGQQIEAVGVVPAGIMKRLRSVLWHATRPAGVAKDGKRSRRRHRRGADGTMIPKIIPNAR